MISNEQLLNLVRGNGSSCFFMVETPTGVLPTVVLNIYVNLGCNFVTMNTIALPPDRLSLNNNPRYANHYVFETTLENYTTNFGEYVPESIIKFSMGVA
jgi:hypothetical protein